MLTIIYKIYNYEKLNIEIPLICCECYEKIEENEFLNYSKKMIDFYILNIVLTLFFFIYFIYSLSLFYKPSGTYFIYIIPIIIIAVILVLFIIYKCGIKTYYFIRGINFYKKNFEIKKEKEN